MAYFREGVTGDLSCQTSRSRIDSRWLFRIKVGWTDVTGEWGCGRMDDSIFVPV